MYHVLSAAPLKWSEIHTNVIGRARPSEVAEALFPAQVQHVEKAAEENPTDEFGESRRLAKYVAYVNRFDEAKAIGARLRLAAEA